MLYLHYMQKFLNFDISFFSVLLLLVLNITIKVRKNSTSTSSRLLLRLIWTTIYMLLLEVISWQFNEKPGIFNWYANYISNMLFAWSTPIITCVWASYIDYHMFKSYKRLQKRFFYVHALAINTVFIIINFFTPFIFSVDTQNIYKREPFMWLIVLINTITFIYICSLTYRNKSKINKEIIVVLLSYIFLPVVAAGLQVIIYGAFILWPTMAVTVVLTYIFLETVTTSTDYLTGLVNRLRIDDYLEFYLDNKKVFTVIIIDLNDFKEINDNYGHINGDLALKLFSRNLKKVFNKANIIGRYGGDEFIILTEVHSKDEISELFNNLRMKLSIICKEKELPFTISFSYGNHENCPQKNYNYETIVNITDKKMYENKLLLKGSKK